MIRFCLTKITYYFCIFKFTSTEYYNITFVTYYNFINSTNNFIYFFKIYYYYYFSSTKNKLSPSIKEKKINTLGNMLYLHHNNIKLYN